MDILKKLFGGDIIVKVMRVFLFHPQTAYDMQTLKQKTGSESTHIRKALTTLVRATFLKTRGNTKWVLNSDCIYLSPLRDLLIGNLLNSIDLAGKIRKAGKVTLLIASGVFINEKDARTDLLIVGDRIDEKLLSKAIGSIESEIGTDIKYSFFMTGEFQYRVSINDKLIRDVLDFSHEILLNKLK